MKERLIKWIPALALVSFVAAVFLIADGYYWNGIAFIGVGASLYSAAVIYKNVGTDGSEKGK